MKITVGQLRRIIKEEVEKIVDEMSLGAVGRTVNKDRKSDDDSDLRAVTRLHDTPKYKKEAEISFRLLETTVYVVPVFTNVGIGRSERTRAISWDEAEPIIVESGLDPESIKPELEAEKACVILSHTSGLVPGFLPTPWMILHSLFDSPRTDLYKKITSRIIDFINNLTENAIKKIPSYDDIDYGLLSTLTMKSALNGKITVDNKRDWAAEMATQASRSKHGMTTKPYTWTRPHMPDKLRDSLVQSLKKYGQYIDESDPRAKIINDMADELRDFVNGLNIRTELDNYLKGKIIHANVSNIFDE